MSTKTCFVIAPIGEKESDTRKRSDQILKHIIAPAVKERGFKPIRADEISEPGIITTQIIQRIMDSELVIADLTDRNPNVFYELAIRHAIRKPLIQLIKKGEPIPFDVSGMRTIQFDQTDLDSVDETKNEIIKQIDAGEKEGAIIETPISVTIDLKTLRNSSDPQERMLGDIASSINDLKHQILNLSLKVTSPHSEYNPNIFPRTFLKSNLQNDNKDNSLAMLAHFLAETDSTKNKNKNTDDLVKALKLIRSNSTKK